MEEDRVNQQHALARAEMLCNRAHALIETCRQIARASKSALQRMRLNRP